MKNTYKAEDIFLTNHTAIASIHARVCQNFSAALAATVRSLPLTFDAGLPEKRTH